MFAFCLITETSCSCSYDILWVTRNLVVMSKKLALTSGFGEEIMKRDFSLFLFPPHRCTCLFVAAKLYPVSIPAFIMTSSQLEQEDKNIKCIPCFISSLAELQERCLWPTAHFSNRTYCILTSVCQCYLKVRVIFLSQVDFQTQAILKLWVCWQSWL